jgi:uncharacterized protein YndB with AHSA1/START domain
MSKTTFQRDERNARLTIERAFEVDAARVWRALTDPALLDRWWAPQPWQTQTIHMDFQVGGYWLYAMNGPDGEQHFGRMDYLEIDPGIRYKASDAFTDAEGTPNESLPRQDMELSLIATGTQTRIVTVVQYASIEDMNTILEMGMAEGITIAHDQLAALLAAD